MPIKAATVDEYLAALPEDSRAVLEDLRAVIKNVAPQATEVISYGIPAFKVEGGVVGGFSASKNHFSFFPFSGAIVEQFAGELTDFDCARGTVRFTADHRLPDDVVRRMIEAHMEANRRA